jgi:hypothetical protein
MSHPSSDAWAEAQAAAEELREELRRIDAILPSLGIDVPAAIGGFPLVSLGSAPAATIRKIAEQLRAARER